MTGPKFQLFPPPRGSEIRNYNRPASVNESRSVESQTIIRVRQIKRNFNQFDTSGKVGSGGEAFSGSQNNGGTVRRRCPHANPGGRGGEKFAGRWRACVYTPRLRRAVGKRRRRLRTFPNRPESLRRIGGRPEKFSTFRCAANRCRMFYARGVTICECLLAGMRGSLCRCKMWVVCKCD